ncbi:thymidylate synthase [Selenomonas montiformis]|uniref:thymidylate synthase n=1 Tax=Selenomonas montiformis TaxID=2652285 RepID=UPI003F8B8DD4
MSLADTIFQANIADILLSDFNDNDQNVRPHWVDGTPAHTKMVFGLTNRYDLSKEFPALTLRPVNFKAAVDEIIWIWQKKSNRVADLHSHIWDLWAGEDGTIGKAYGYQLGKKAKYPEGEFDQVDRVLWQLKNEPASRRIITNIYNFEDLNEMNLYPCAYSMTFVVTGNKLNGILNQRSNDMLVANNWNVVQYAVLLHMFAQVSGLEVGELVHVIANAHIYDRHEEIAKEVIRRNPYPAPKLKINKSVKNFYDFKVEDFELVDYQHGETVKGIPVAI